VATSSHARLYLLVDGDGRGKVKAKAKIKVKSLQGGEIRAAQLSDDLLVIVTNSHLYVYELNPKGLEYPMVKEISQIKRPNAVHILQEGYGSRQGQSQAWIAVGGQGVNGVSLFRCCTYYTSPNTWSLQEERVILPCEGNFGCIRLVNFSTQRDNEEGEFRVLGVTDSNRIHCWTLRRHTNTATLQSHCDLDVSGGNVAPVSNRLLVLCLYFGADLPKTHSGYITSASIFVCPLGQPYVFCSVNHKRGTNLPPTFVAPIKTSYTSRSERATSFGEKCFLPELESGEVLGGVVSHNGHFLVAVERNEMVLLAFQEAFDGLGGLTCMRPVRWKCRLKAGTAEHGTLSIAVKESTEKLEIVAVDGKGSVVSADVHVRGMPAPLDPPSFPDEEPPEAPGDSAIFQLSSGESTESYRRSSSNMTSGPS
jgi:hypothetical protein